MYKTVLSVIYLPVAQVMYGEPQMPCIHVHVLVFESPSPNHFGRLAAEL